VITRLHDGVAFQVLTPNLGAPITDGKEILKVTGVSLDVVDGAVMLALLEAELKVDFDLLTLVGLQDVTLLGTDKVLKRGGIRVVLKTGTSKNLRPDLTIDSEVLDENKLLSGTTLKVPLIPPKKAAISGCRDALGTGLTGNPVHIIDGVVMRLLEHRG